MALTTMMARRARGTALLFVLAALFATPPGAAAQPVVRNILDHAELTRSERGAALRVYFRFPVHYVRHFPYESGETLLIQVTPEILGAPEGKAPGHREALRPPDDPDIPLTDIVFDNRTLWSPYLILHFSRRVDFRVSPGPDFRSVIVEFPAATPAQPATLTPAVPPAAGTP
jgi:hypothetical protein